MSNKSQIVINNKKIINFYRDNPSISIEDVNIYFINMLETIASNNTISQISNLEKIINSTKNEMLNATKMNKEFTKDNNEIIINRIKESLNNVNNQIELNLNKKIVSLYSNMLLDMKQMKETIPSKEYLLTNFRKEIEKIDNNKNNIELMESIFSSNIELTYEKIKNHIDKSQNTLSNNFNEIKSISTNIVNLSSNTNEKLSNHLDNFNNSSKKGNICENLLYNILNEILPEAEITNSSNESETGDFLIEINNIKLMIETKDYKDNVKKKEVDKFYRDIKKQNCHGIFLSQNSGISTKNDLEIGTFNDNIVLFAHNVNYNHDKIKLLINTILYLENILKKNNNKDILITKDILTKLNDEYINFINQKNILIDELKDYYNKTLKTYNNINLDSLQLFLSSYFSNQIKQTFVCKLCKKYTAQSKRSLARHEQACKKKHNLTDESTEESTEDSIDNNSQNISV